MTGVLDSARCTGGDSFSPARPASAPSPWHPTSGASPPPRRSRQERGPYGPLLDEPDANGLLLPEGFTSRVIAVSGQVVEGTDYTWPRFPDGAAIFPAEGDGWLYAVNHEDIVPGEGGVSVVRFDADGSITDAYSDPRRHPHELRRRPHAMEHLALL